MTSRWDPASHIAKLPEMPLAELCAKLRGEYDRVHEPHPISVEAARRLEAMDRQIGAWKQMTVVKLSEENEGLRARITKLEAEIERLKEIEGHARRQGIQLPSRIGGLFG